MHSLPFLLSALLVPRAMRPRRLSILIFGRSISLIVVRGRGELLLMTKCLLHRLLQLLPRHRAQVVAEVSILQMRKQERGAQQVRVEPQGKATLVPQEWMQVQRERGAQQVRVEPQGKATLVPQEWMQVQREQGELQGRVELQGKVAVRAQEWMQVQREQGELQGRVELQGKVAVRAQELLELM